MDKHVENFQIFKATQACDSASVSRDGINRAGCSQPYFGSRTTLQENQPNLVEKLLLGHDKLTFRQNKNMGFRGTSMIYHIRGAENQLVIYAVRSTTTKKNEIPGEDYFATTITFLDPAGKVLMTSQQTGQFLQQYRISSGGKILGLIDGAAFSLRGGRQALEGRTNNGNIVYQVENQGSDYIFTSNNGRAIAVAKIIDGLFQLELTERTLDSQSRTIVIVGAYYLFLLYQAYGNCLQMQKSAIDLAEIL